MSPDRLFRNSSQTIGVEITEAVPETYADADEYRNVHSPASLVDRSHFQPGGLGETAEPQQMLRDAATKDDSPGWANDAVERELAGLVQRCLQKKTAKLAKHYDRFDEDWLIIYASDPGPDPDLASTRAMVGLPSVRKSDDFHRVFLLLDTDLICLRSGATCPVEPG